MITIKRTNDSIHISGHTLPDICSGVSCIVYTVANCLDRYDKTCIDFEDNVEEDYIHIKVNRRDDVIDVMLFTMWDMFLDMLHQVPVGCISLLDSMEGVEE